jgi:hypothetical protein
VQITALASVPGGGVAIGGYVSKPADFGSGSLTNIDYFPPFLAEFDSAGRTVYATLFCSTQPAGADAIGSIARDANSTVFVAPFSTDFEVGSAHFDSSFGSALVDMPP